MQSLIKLSATFARVPSIKFLGPRDQIKPETQHKVAPSSVPTPTKSAVSSITKGPAVNAFPGLFPTLESWQSDAINSGGAIDLKYLKVKSIPLRKK